MNAYIDEIDSTVGTVAFATNEEGVLLGLWFRDGRRPASLENGLKREGFALSRDKDKDRTAATREQLVEYFAGERRSFDLPIARRGTLFQEDVWEELSRIPFGETCTYGQVAEAIGWPGEAIEVGSACAANPVLLVLPCHRVVGADGSLKGYAGGILVKERLLAFEAEPEAALRIEDKERLETQTQLDNHEQRRIDMLSTTTVAKRVEELDWSRIGRVLDERGYASMPRILSKD